MIFPAYNEISWAAKVTSPVNMTLSRSLPRILTLAMPILAAIALRAECVSFTDAHQHVGKTQCISGTVFHVKEGSKGVTFLDFCETFETCPFTVVVFPGEHDHRERASFEGLAEVEEGHALAAFFHVED